jgi:hypothetical protein
MKAWLFNLSSHAFTVHRSSFRVHTSDFLLTPLLAILKLPRPKTLIDICAESNI